MRILFIENRAKTFFWEAIAKKLQKSGHLIHWIIQNNSYLPETGELNIINYPQNEKIVNEEYSEVIQRIIKADRQVNFFGSKSTDYFYYYNEKIEQILQKVKPNIVFGESTAFHELLVIENCKNRNILYLNPSSCRYPLGRFSFYKYDSLDPYYGSNEILSEVQAIEILQSIVSRKVRPDYMKIVKPSRPDLFKERILKIRSYYNGEKYNTPSPITKFKIEKTRKANILHWDKIAMSNISDEKDFNILYPLQMQPEANIDVWGRKYRNQLEVIKALLHHTSEDCYIYIKPNPKSKYEITNELIAFVNNERRVILLKHEVKMGDVFSKIDLVVTVTGTIAIECILANKPVLTLVKTQNNYNRNCLYLENFGDLGSYINLIKKEKFPQLSTEEKVDFINLLNIKSYSGIISDPFSDRFSTSEENIDKIVRAFRDVLNSINVL